MSVSGPKIQEQKGIGREMFGPPVVDGNGNGSAGAGDTIRPTNPGQPRIAFKAKGRIVFLSLAEIVAVQAEGNYVSLRRQPSAYLLRESLASMAEKLKPYGFIRIHRSVVVNISAVEDMQPLPTGEYRLRIKGGEQYLVTRTYKNNLRHLAQLWVGSERLCS
jgi:DNA-binding LytR/AlgR family response regulator